MKMKVMVKSVTRSQGTSFKKNKLGKDFDISTVNCLAPLEPRSWDKEDGSGTLTGFGAQDYELPLDPRALNAFAPFDYPCELDLITEDRVMFGRMTQVVVGCKPNQAVKAA
jgi:hypothetical protein